MKLLQSKENPRFCLIVHAAQLSLAEPPGTTGNELGTTGVPIPGLPAASGRQKPGGLRSFHPRAA